MREKKTLRIVFIFLLIYVLYFCVQKDHFNGDEMFSYSLSNGYYTPFLRWNSDWWNTWHPISYLTDQLTINESEGFQYGSVVYNQSNDVHPPFFYMVLHTICSFFPGIFSKWIGLGLNIVLYMLSVILVYWIACVITNNDFYCSLITCLLYAVCAGTITNAIYIRMYMLCTVIVLTDLFMHFTLKRFNLKHLILLMVLTFR